MNSELDIAIHIPPVCMFVCLKHSGIVSKRLNISSTFFHRPVYPHHPSTVKTKCRHEIQTDHL